MQTLTENKTGAQLAAAQGLYGPGWLNLPQFVRDAVEDVLPRLLALSAAAAIEEGSGSGWRLNDYAYEWLPLCASDVLDLLDGVSLDDLGGLACLPATDYEGDALLELVVSALASVFGQLLYRLTCCAEVESWQALGLDVAASEVAARLLPEWSGTVAELLEAAPRI